MKKNIFCIIVICATYAQISFALEAVDYSRPICGVGTDSEYDFGRWNEIDLSSNALDIKRVFCQTAYMNAGGVIPKKAKTLISDVANAILSHPDWRKRPDTKYAVGSLIRKLLDSAHEIRYQKMAKEIPRRKSEFGGRAKARKQSKFMKDLNRYGTRCERGDASEEDCSASPKKMKRRWKKYVKFLKRSTNQSSTAKKAMEKMYKAADRPPFSGRKDIKILPMLPHMRKSAEGYVAPVKQKDGSFRMVIYLNPEQDPIEAISTLAHEANHASEFTSQTTADYDVMNTHRPNYDRYNLSYKAMSSVHNFWRRVCFSSPMAAPGGRLASACKVGRCGRIGANGPSGRAMTPCSHSEGGYMARNGSRIDPKKAIPSRTWKKLEQADVQMAEGVREYCGLYRRSFALPSGTECNTKKVFGFLKMVRNMSGDDPGSQAAIDDSINRLKQLQQDQKAYRLIRSFRDDSSSAGSFYYNHVDPDTSWKNVRDTFESARTAYAPVRRRISRETLASEFRAHNISWQVISDLTVNHKHAICQRSLRRDNKIIPLAKAYNNDRNEMLCGDYLCGHIAVPYTASGVGMQEVDIFGRKGWSIDVTGNGGNDDLSKQFDDENRKLSTMAGPNARCIKDGKPSPLRPLRYNCSAEAGKRARRPSKTK